MGLMDLVLHVKNLLKAFKSMKNIQEASIEELKAIGLPKNVAENVYEKFKQPELNPELDSDK